MIGTFAFAHARRLTASALLSLTLCGLAAHPAEAKRAKVVYVPGIQITPEELLADGKTPRQYRTPQGVRLYQSDLPVVQGDRFKINVFVATGPDALKTVKIRLDNAPLAELAGTPWATTLDTKTLSPGYHLLEVWAQTSADPAQSASKTLSFFVSPSLPVQYAVQGAQQTLTEGQVAPLTPAPPLPAFLAGKTVDPDAVIGLRARPAAAQTNSAWTPIRSAFSVTDPIIIAPLALPKTTATQFAYAITRGERTIIQSDTPIDLVKSHRTVIKIQKRSDTQPGLLAGDVTLWVWGIDKEGRPGDPVKTTVTIE